VKSSFDVENGKISNATKSNNVARQHVHPGLTTAKQNGRRIENNMNIYAKTNGWYSSHTLAVDTKGSLIVGNNAKQDFIKVPVSQELLGMRGCTDPYIWCGKDEDWSGLDLLQLINYQDGQLVADPTNRKDGCLVYLSLEHMGYHNGKFTRFEGTEQFHLVDQREYENQGNGSHQTFFGRMTPGGLIHATLWGPDGSEGGREPSPERKNIVFHCTDHCFVNVA